MSNKANGAFGSELFNQSIPIGGNQSNKTNQPLPTPKNNAEELSSGVPVSEHDRMTRMIQEKSAPTSSKEVADLAAPQSDVLVPWKEMERKADKALFLAQQGKQVNEIARLVGWSTGSVKTTFSSWKKKQLVDGRASNIKPTFHESHLPTFRHLFLVERIGKAAIIERFEFHPSVVDDAFYRLKREKRIGGSPDQPLVLEPATKKPEVTLSLPEARAIITDCFIEKKMNRDKIVNVHPEVESFINKVFKELFEDGELLGTAANPIVKTKVPDPVYQVGQKSAPPLREKEVVPKEPFKPKFEPLPKPQPEPQSDAPRSSTKLTDVSRSSALADEAQIKKLKETLGEIESMQAASKKNDDPPSSTKLTDVPPRGKSDDMDMDGFDEIISNEFKSNRTLKERRDETMAKLTTPPPATEPDPIMGAINEIVADSFKDNPYVQSLTKQLEEERALSKRLASEIDLIIPWEDNPETKELKRQLDEARAQLKESSGTPVDPYEDADTKDDGTFRHLAAAQLDDELPPIFEEVGRLHLQHDTITSECLRAHINLLIQSLTICGATDFAVDLTLKGKK